jgi:hypothetical protein
MSKQAQKAYLEIDTAEDSISQIDEDGKLTQGQSFILTGTLGSRQFSFGAGTSISQVVTAIESYSGSTGINASLTFNSTQKINQTVAGATDISIGDSGNTDTRNANAMTIFDNYYTDADGGTTEIVASMSGCVSGVQYGMNTDGQGRIYIKVTGEGTYELYKDASLSAESLVGSGKNGEEMTERNNSKLSGLNITLDTDAKYGSVAYLSTGGISLGSDNACASGVMKSANSTGAKISGTFDLANSIASGVQLGINTDAAGKIYTKIEIDDAGLATVYAYSDESRSAEYLVAKSEDDIDVSSANGAVILNAIWNDEHTASTGLALHLNFITGFAEGTTQTGEIAFTNLGARISTTEYGSDAFIQIPQFEGGIFTYYDQSNKASSATLVDAGGTGVTYRQYGQDATVNVNGQQMKTSGLSLDMATTDIMAKVVFNAGKTGSTTIAQVGYTEGSIFTKNTSLTFDLYDASAYTDDNAGFSALLNNA